MRYIPQQQGFIHYIILIFVIIFALGYFGIDVQKIYNDERFQTVAAKTIDISLVVWEDILKVPFILMMENVRDKVTNEQDLYFQGVKERQDARTTLPEE